MNERKYFELNFDDYIKVIAEIERGRNKIRLSLSARGGKASLSVKKGKESDLRKILKKLGINFSESEKLQVVTLFDGLLR